MKFYLFATAPLAAVAFSPSAFVPKKQTSATVLKGYLDDLSNELNAPDANPDPEAESREATKLAQDKISNYGVGDWKDFVDFEEFDGGDGQMGVAGDGNKGLDKEWKGQAQMFNSKMMSAKNAWGTSTGYADQLRDQGVETSRAQQLENWHNQREVLSARNAQKWMTDEFDKVSADENWRDLSKFGVERNQEFDLDIAFGDVSPGGNDMGVIELSSNLNRNEIYEFNLKNSFMGFSDFRAKFTADTNEAEWKVEPTEGSLNGRGAPTEFVVKFRPSSIGLSQGYLVIETEDDKWTWKLMGTGSM